MRKKYFIFSIFCLICIVMLMGCVRKVNVRFIDYDGTVLKIIELKKGQTVEAPESPTREGYTFKGWDASLEKIEQDIDIHALYDINTYKVEFKDYDGTMLKTETVEHGTSATAPVDPEREGYTFSKWDKAFSNVTSNLEIYATYDIRTYTVQFKDYDGTMLKTETVEHGTSATAPVDPEREGYTFSKWDKAFSNVTSNLEIYATYDIRTYTVQFKDYDGTMLKTETVEHGTNATAPVDPEREGYTFSKWDKAFSNITSNLEVYATYDIRTYTVQFKDYDGSMLKTETVEHGTNATAPVDPEREGYTFSKWDKAFSNITSNLEVIAEYLEIYQIHYVQNTESLGYIAWSDKETFLNELYGDIFTWLMSKERYISERIKRVANGIELTYTDSKAASKVVLITTMQELRNSDIYAAEDSWGQVMYKPFSRLTEEEIIFEENNDYFFQSEPYRTKYRRLDQYFYHCIKTSYSSYSTGYMQASSGRVQIFFRFHQWNKGTVISAFNELPQKLTISDLSNGSIVLPSNPKEFTENDTFVIPNPLYSDMVFLGWYDNPWGAGNPITNIGKGTKGDITLFAKWDLDPSSHEVIFMDYDGTILKKEYLSIGDTLIPPTPPVHLGYEFVGWDKEYQNITCDIVFTAKYKLKEYSITYNPNLEGIEVELDESRPLHFTVQDQWKLPPAIAQGYVFIGWYDNPEGTGNRISETGSKDLILYARWIESPEIGGSAGTEGYFAVSSEMNIDLGMSARAYLKKGTDYIHSCDIVYISNNPNILTIDDTGFMRGIASGVATVLLFHQDNYGVMTITVNDTDSPVVYVGHQGSGGPVVQNAKSAFEEGGRRGYYALECDVRVATDSVYYICHDDVFKSTLFTDSSLYNKLMGGYAWSTLKDLEIYDTYNGQTYYETLCTVEEYLLICKKYGVKALLELKWTNGINSNDNSKLAGLVTLVKQCGMYENAIFMTSMKNCLEFLYTNYPDANLQFLSGTSSTVESNFKWCIEHHISLDAPNNLVTAAIVQRMHNAGLYVNAYTVDSETVANNLIRYGVDMITTNHLGKKEN